MLSMVALGLITAALLYSTTYQKKMMTQITSSSNVESLTIQKNGYEDVFSFDGFIESYQLENLYSVLNKNDSIQSAWSSIDFPAFLSIRKASVYVDMSFSQEIGSDNIVEGRMYNINNNANEVVIGSGLSAKYGIPYNSVVAIVVKDFDNVYTVTNLYVSGISHFEGEESKNNKGYISQKKFKEIMAINTPDEYIFTQRLNIVASEEADIKSMSDYIKNNIDTNLFSLKENLIKTNVVTEDIIKETSKSIMAVFMIAIILTICSIMRIMLFRIGKQD